MPVGVVVLRMKPYAAQNVLTISTADQIKVTYTAFHSCGGLSVRIDGLALK